jgi:hypothetical protein
VATHRITAIGDIHASQVASVRYPLHRYPTVKHTASKAEITKKWIAAMLYHDKTKSNAVVLYVECHQR